jgi:hypothetical protein
VESIKAKIAINIFDDERADQITEDSMKPRIFSLQMNSIDETSSLIIFELGLDENSKQKLEAKAIKSDPVYFQFDDATSEFLLTNYLIVYRALLGVLDKFYYGETIDLPYIL